MAHRDPTPTRTRNGEPGAWLMTASALGGLVAALLYYFWRGNGIAYTEGVLLVIGTTAILLVAAVLLATRVVQNGFVIGFLVVGCFIDILGTAFGAWMLEAHWCLALIGLAGLGWLIHIAFDAPVKTAARVPTSHLQESPQ